MALKGNELMSTMVFCPRKLFLERVLGFIDGYERERVLRDEIFDEALRYTNTFEEGIIRSIKSPMVESRVHDLYKSSHSRALQEAIITHKGFLLEAGMSLIETSRRVWKDLSLSTEMKARNTHSFMARNRVYGNELWWSLVPKITYNLELESSVLGCSVVIDRVDNYPHHAVAVLVRRGSPPEKGLWYSDKLVLAACMMVLAEHNRIVHEGVVLYSYGNVPRELVLSAELSEQVKGVLDSSQEIVSSKILPQRITQLKKCDSCPFKSQCFDDEYMADVMQKKGF